MAQGNKIGSYQTLLTFTVNVPYAQSKRYGTTQSSTTFTVGYEYTGANFYKSASRPPKIRILAAVKPVISATGSPNANNDTYIAYQTYDYTLARWRGQECGRASDSSTHTYMDYFFVTLDRFGQSIGNTYAGNGASSTTFTAPTVVTGVGVYANSIPYNNGAANAVATANHADSVWTWGTSNSSFNTSSIHFNGFFYFDYAANPNGYVEGKYCFYTLRKYPIGGSASNKTFRHTADRATYTSGTYPYLTQTKFTSEWRYAPLCDVTKALGYTPYVKNYNGGGVRVYSGEQNPAQAFPNNLYSILDVYSPSPPGTAINFFSGEHLIYADPQGLDFAPAGWYGFPTENSYQRWTGTGWLTNTYATYTPGGGTSYTSHSFGHVGNTAAQACANTFGELTVYSNNLTNWYSDSAGTTPFNGGNGWFQDVNSHIAYQIDIYGVAIATYDCNTPSRTTMTLSGPFGDPTEACMFMGGPPPTTAYTDGSTVYTASSGSETFNGMNMWWYNQNDNTSYSINDRGGIDGINPC